MVPKAHTEKFLSIGVFLTARNRSLEGGLELAVRKQTDLVLFCIQFCVTASRKLESNPNL